MPTADPIEVSVARLDERLKQMADDQRRMAESYEKLVESNERISLLEKDVSAHKESIQTLWLKHDALVVQFDSHRQTQGKLAGAALYDILKIMVAAAIGAALAHWGAADPAAAAVAPSVHESQTQN